MWESAYFTVSAFLFLYSTMVKLKDEIKQTRFRNTHQEAAINILFTSGWLFNKQKDFFKPYGITGQQFNVLSILRGQHPAKTSGAEIKSRMLDKNSDVSRILDRLLLKKLIIKNQCPNDKRAADIEISQAGLNLLATIDSNINALDVALANLTEEEAAQLSRLLDKARG